MKYSPESGWGRDEPVEGCLERDRDRHMCGVEDADVGMGMDVGMLWFEGIGDDSRWIPPHSGEGWRCGVAGTEGTT